MSEPIPTDSPIAPEVPPAPDYSFKVVPAELLDDLMLSQDEKSKDKELINFLEDNFLRYTHLNAADQGSGPNVLWRELQRRVVDMQGDQVCVFLIPNVKRLSNPIALRDALLSSIDALYDADCIFLYVDDVETWGKSFDDKGLDVIKPSNRYTFEVNESLSLLVGDRNVINLAGAGANAKLFTFKRKGTDLQFRTVIDVDAGLNVYLGGVPMFIEGQADLHTAAMAGDMLAIERFGGDIERVNREGLTALQVAATHLQPAAFKALIKKGANFNVKDREKGRTLAHLAMNTSTSSASLVQYLRASLGAQPTARNSPPTTRNGNDNNQQRAPTTPDGNDTDRQPGQNPPPSATQYGGHRPPADEDDDLITVHFRHQDIESEFLVKVNARATLGTLRAVAAPQIPTRLTFAWHLTTASASVDITHEANSRALRDVGIVDNVLICLVVRHIPLHVMIRDSQTEAIVDAIGYALDNDVQFVDDQGRTLLHIAAESIMGRGESTVDRNDGHLVIRALLGRNVDLSARDHQGNTPLHVAARSRQEAICRLLIDAGADIGVKNNDGRTPLDELLSVQAAEEQRILQIFQVLVDVDAADLLHVGDNEGNTPLHLAASIGLTNVVSYLAREAILTINRQNKEGRTPAHLAADGDHIASLEALVAAAANLTIQDTDGQTPVHVAASRSNTSIYDYLLHQANNGALLVDKWGNTPAQTLEQR